MNRSCLRWIVLVSLVGAVLYAWTPPAPETRGGGNRALSGTNVIERLPAMPVRVVNPPLHRASTRADAGASTDPVSLEEALGQAEVWIERSRAEADPRFLGYAQRVLSPWTKASGGSGEIPVPVIFLRGVIRQSLHDFRGAVEDLRSVVRHDPNHARAWVTLAAVHLAQGAYPEARTACGHLLRCAPELVAATASAALASLTGQAVGAYTTLDRILQRNSTRPRPERAWAESTLGEIAVRRGLVDDARKHFQRALELNDADTYTRALLADLLLDQGEPGAVLTLLRPFHQHDGLLLRVALAEQQLHGRRSVLQGTGAVLQQRFEAARRRNEIGHDREEALFVLRLLGDAPKALALAVRNWELQREPIDLLVLLEAARAAGAETEWTTASRWVDENRLEDVRVATLRAGTPRLAGAHPSWSTTGSEAPR